MVLTDLESGQERKLLDGERHMESDLCNVTRQTADVIGNKIIEEKDLKHDLNLIENPVERQPKDFSKGNFKMAQFKHTELLGMRERIKEINVSLKDMNPRIFEARRNYERKKEVHYQISIKLEELGRQIKKLKMISEMRGISLLGNNTNLNRKQPLTEVAKSVFCDDDLAAERRYNARREVAVHRRNNQLRIANLNRGLVMDEDDKEISESDGTFDLTSLDKALPPVSHCKRVPGMRRSLKLQDVVMNSIKGNRLVRLASAELFSMDTITSEENS